MSVVPTALAGYDQAVNGVPPNVASDIRALRDLTAASTAAAEDSSSAEDWNAKLLALPGLDQASSAGQRLNDFATSTCGFSVVN